MTRAIVLLISLFVPLIATGNDLPKNPPNIIVFLVDDMGWQETSVPFHVETTELNRRYRTPNMERLAAEGMKFTQAYASAVCSPTRVSLMSGMNVARHRVTNWTLRKNQSPDNKNEAFEPPQWNLNGLTTEAGIERTTRVTPLPACLQAVGYRTIHVGKAHFGAQGTPGENPSHLGFDINIGGHAAGGPGSYWGEKNFSAAWRNADRIWDVPGLGKYHGQNVYLTEALTLEAIDAVTAAVHDEQPFFLYLSHYAVHAPWEKDDRFYQKYLDTGLPPFEATLASMIEGMDQSLGDVCDAIQRLGVEQNTVILFLSDNGSPSQCPRNLPLRGHKLTPYEGGVRVPMIAKWPGVTPANSVNANPVVIEDFFPTILDLAGVTMPETLQTIDGLSFMPLLKDNKKNPDTRELVWHYPHQYSGQSPFSSIRRGPWKLIYHHVTKQLELFNLAEDIGETTDVSTTKPDVVRELTRRLGQRLRGMDAQMPLDIQTGKPIAWPDQVLDRQTSPAQVVDVYLLGGQSNMQGVGKIAALTADVPKEIPHTFFWNGQQFEPLVLGQTKTSSNNINFGPEIGFALAMATADRPIYLIKYHASGMPLHHGWDGDKWISDEPQPGRRNFYPGQTDDDANTGSLYREMRSQFQNGTQHLEMQGMTPVVRGLVWMQGEQDAKHVVSASTYASSLNQLRKRLAEDLQTQPDLPLVFGQVLPHDPPAARFTHRQEIRTQMAACDSKALQPESMRNTTMVPTEGLTLLPDTVHYDSTGQLSLGKAFATAMQQLVGEEN